MRRTPFQVELRRTDTTVTVTPDISVLQAIRRARAEVLCAAAAWQPTVHRGRLESAG
ncbi:hypothetical protein ACFV7R_25885 [Streptomyces sp. NPDC059866]|uniref:hypothetical protein n=1 Tax=Streptomyces sp. NPDC059866 TaxID=3346978 RepID=UPI0036534FFA